MSTARIVLACLSVLVVWAQSRPAVAAGMGNTPPTVTSIRLAPEPVGAGSTATITCTGADTDGSVRRVAFTVTGGTLPNGAMTFEPVVTAAPTVTASVAWATPGVGTYDVKCQVWDSGGMFGGSATATRTVSVDVVVTKAPPVLDALVSSASTVLPGATVHFAAAGRDPEGGVVTYEWSAADGALLPRGDGASWVAPTASGTYEVFVAVVNDAGGRVSSSLRIDVAPSLFVGGLEPAMRAPRRLSSSPSGALHVVDGATGDVWFLTPRGETKAIRTLPEPAESVCACAGAVYVASRAGRVFELDASQGRVLDELQLSDGPLAGPAGIGCDEANRVLFAAEHRTARVRAFDTAGNTLFFLASANDTPLEAPVDVVVDADESLVWVLLATREQGDLLHAFSLSGTWQRSMAPVGSGKGKVSRGSGLALRPGGRIYVSDSFQGVVHVFEQTGVEVGLLGGFGFTAGKLRQPSGLAHLRSGELVVANLDFGRLERFGIGAPLPECEDDADCDDLPDAWELANGLNPFNPRDAVADADGDDRSNADEFAAGTDPRKADSDGDGVPDGAPLPSTAELIPGDPVESNPGLVRLSARLVASGPCSVSWFQVEGPRVVLRDGASATPAFIAREAGTYRFEGRTRCTGAVSEPATVEARVRNVPPRADPGRLRALRVGDRFVLDGRFSVDANGGALSYTWDQLQGPAALASTPLRAAAARAHRPGHYAFALSVEDPDGESSTAEVGQIVVDSDGHGPTALALSPILAVAGRPVVVDASDSVAGPSPRFLWRQVAGAEGTLSGTRRASATFVPPAPGRYTLEVVVFDGAASSPPALVEVYATPPARALPLARATAVPVTAVGEPFVLDGRASRPTTGTGRLSYAWRQVSGPACGLNGLDAAVATGVAFGAGSYVFELTVSDDGVPSLPTLVRVEADEPGVLRLLALAAGSGSGTVGDRLELRGEARAANAEVLAGAPLPPVHFRWTQVGGPWVALDDPTAARPSFVPRLPGLYVFELEIDDGVVRSAPAPVGVLVFPRVSGGGQP